jgi:hypothetical protein
MKYADRHGPHIMRSFTHSVHRQHITANFIFDRALMNYLSLK